MPKAQAPDPLAGKLAAIERENARLKAENAKLQLIFFDVVTCFELDFDFDFDGLADALFMPSE